MKKSFWKHYRNEFNPKYNSHIKPKQHAGLERIGHGLAWAFLSLVSLVVIAGLVIAGTFFLYRDADNEAKQRVTAQVERNARPQEPVYDQNSLNQSSNHSVAKQMVNSYKKVDSGFVNHVTYNSKRDVANVTLNRPAVNAVKYASNMKKTRPEKLTKSLRTGVEINDLLSNQAVEIANQAHDGYFTFKFTNANNYQAPNTKTGDYNE